MFGIFIGDAGYWNKGIGTEAASLCLDFAFNVLNMHTVYLYVYDYNKRAIASYKKIGFKVTGKKGKEGIMPGKDTTSLSWISLEVSLPVPLSFPWERSDYLVIW